MIRQRPGSRDMCLKESSGDYRKVVSIVIELPADDATLDTVLWAVFGATETSGGEVVAVGVME